MINYIPIRKLHESENGFVVVEVKEKCSDKHYALKLIGPLSFPLNRIIFERENSALKVLNGYDEIVHTYSVAKKLTYNGNKDFGGILLELISGSSLEHFNSTEYSDVQKYNICIQIARGILHAHNNGIIHRDIKPSNIMLTDSGKIKIIDFGSSKIKSLVERDTTRNLYSPIYSAPEVLSGGIVDEASDVFSIGAVYYRIFWGQDPPTSTTKFIDSVSDSKLRGNFKALLLRMINPNSEDRLRDPSVIIEELRNLIGNLNIQAKKYVFRVDSSKMDLLKKSNMILQNTTIQQFTSSILPKEFTEIYGNYEDDKYVFCGSRIHMDCIFNKDKETFDVFNLYNITLSQSIKLKKLYSFIEGTVKFISFQNNVTVPNNNYELQNILKDHSSNIWQAQKQKQLFDQLFGRWEDSIQESLETIKNKNAQIFYSDYELTNRQLILTVTQYKNRVIDEIPPETRYVIEDNDGPKTSFIRIGVFEYVKYEGEDIYLIIELDSKVKLQTITRLLEKHYPVIEDYFFKANAYYKQLLAIKALRNEEYNTHGLKDILLDMAVPGTVSRIKPLKLDNELDDFQKQAVNKALCSESLCLIQGPPGTGKTKVIREILRQLFILEPDKANRIRVLVVSQSNTAVDNVLEGIQDWVSLAGLRALRIGDNKKVSEIINNTYTIEATRNRVFSNVREKSSQYIVEKFKVCETISDANQRTECLELWSKVKEIQMDWLERCGNNEIIDSQLVGSSAIIAGTCIGFLSNEYVRELNFDYVIVDEAAKATTPELLVSIIKANKIILVGDQNQLPPFADEELSPLAAQLVKDPQFRLFDLLYESLPEDNKQPLLTQYRMIQNIGDLISHVFYDDKIHTGIDDEERRHNIPFYNGYSIVWYNTNNLTEHSEKQPVGGSYINISEKTVIHDILRKLNSLENAKDFDIGIITGYSAQRELIKKSVSNSNIDKIKKPVIDTLDAFQGRQNDIIIYSTVRTEKSIGFQKEKERINVAFSRAKCLLIICGDLDFFYSWDKEENKYIEIIDYIKDNPSTCHIINLSDGDLQ